MAEFIDMLPQPWTQIVTGICFLAAGVAALVGDGKPGSVQAKIMAVVNILGANVGRATNDPAKQ